MRTLVPEVPEVPKVQKVQRVPKIQRFQKFKRFKNYVPIISPRDYVEFLISLGSDTKRLKSSKAVIHKNDSFFIFSR